MTFLGLEQPVTQESRKIFDPTMANMVLQALQLYNEAVKDEYERGLKDMDEFTKTYGDFMSPFEEDMKEYENMLSGIRTVVDDAYSNGVDLLRSPEGRILIRRLTHSINPRDFNTMRANAKIGFEYLLNVQEAIRKGEYDEAFEKFRLNDLGLGDFNSFSSKKGLWTQTGPGKYQDPNTMVSPLFEDMLPEYIPGLDPTGQYDYKGVSRERRAGVLKANIGAILNTQNGRYLYEVSKEKFRQMYGYEPSEEEALEQYQNDLLDASNRFEYQDRSENKAWARQHESRLRMAEDDHRTENDKKLYKYKASVDYDQKTKELMDTDRDGEISESERSAYASAGGTSTSKDKDIVRDAMRTPGSPLQYEAGDPYAVKIAAIDGRIDLVDDEGKACYVIPNEAADGMVYRQEGNKAVPVDRSELVEETSWYSWRDPEGIDDVKIYPNGHIIALETPSGKEAPFIYGTVKATGETVLMPVKSNIHDYNK